MGEFFLSPLLSFSFFSSYPSNIKNNILLPAPASLACQWEFSDVVYAMRNAILRGFILNLGLG